MWFFVFLIWDVSNSDLKAPPQLVKFRIKNVYSSFFSLYNWLTVNKQFLKKSSDFWIKNSIVQALFKFKGVENWSCEVFSCLYCKAGFISQAVLDSHLKKCRTKKKKESTSVLTCDICKKSMLSVKSLNKHVYDNPQS